ncbi:hypothetical protein X975_16379, partial [Stegodyphus mimosarum]
MPSLRLTLRKPLIVSRRQQRASKTVGRTRGRRKRRILCTHNPSGHHFRKSRLRHSSLV